MKKKIYLSVHDVVDSVLRTGDINNKVFNITTMKEGTRLHSLYQGEQDASFLREYFCNFSYELDDMILNVSGKADGVENIGSDIPTIIEIKTTNSNLYKFYENNCTWHEGQALFYAYYFVTEREKEGCKVKLVYISQNKDDDINDNLIIERTYSKDEIIFRVSQIFEKFKILIEFKTKLLKDRNESKDNLFFPFDKVRKGQDELLSFVTNIIENNKVGYIEAATGIGKTISALYPAIRNLLTKENDAKIFYLTSKNSLKEIPVKTSRIFIDNNVKLKCVSITSKDKMCVNSKKGACNPLDCPFACNYYNNLNEYLMEFVDTFNVFDKENITAYCLKKKICPFEFQLDLSNFCDIVIADYNYLFHPTSKLIRYFDDSITSYSHTLLVDEVHNLPERVRDNYSATLNKFDLIELKKELTDKKFKTIKKKIEELLSSFDSIVLDPKDNNELPSYLKNTSEESLPSQKITTLVDSLFTKMDKFNKDNPELVSDKFTDVFFKLKDFIRIYEIYDDSIYSTIYKYDNKYLKCYSITLYCLDGLDFIEREKRKFNSAVFFTATLKPFEYFLELLGNKKEEFDDDFIEIKSPFDKSNQLVLVNPTIDLQYSNRDYTILEVRDLIVKVLKRKVGNYFVYCPNYKYANKLYELLQLRNDIDIFIQDVNMTDDDREIFLSNFKFNPSKTTLGILVLGGIFAEGIDLIESRLIGVIIVSVGLPLFCVEKLALQDYYKKVYSVNKSFEYAYQAPSINKYLQAAGRVIRTENDSGIIFYIDKRYAHTIYKDNLKEQYENFNYVFDTDSAIKLIDKFWRKIDEKV